MSAPPLKPPPYASYSIAGQVALITGERIEQSAFPGTGFCRRRCRCDLPVLSDLCIMSHPCRRKRRHWRSLCLAPGRGRLQAGADCAAGSTAGGIAAW